MENLILALADGLWMIAAFFSAGAVFLAFIVCVIAAPHVFKDIGGGK